MKKYEDCPNCGYDGGFSAGLFISYSVYKCNDCDFTFCCKCEHEMSRGMGYVACPNPEKHIGRQNVKKIGEYYAKHEKPKNKTNYYHRKLRNKYKYPW